MRITGEGEGGTRDPLTDCSGGVMPRVTPRTVNEGKVTKVTENRCFRIPEWVGMIVLWVLAVALTIWRAFFDGPEAVDGWARLVVALAAAWTVSWTVVTALHHAIPLIAESVELRLQMRESADRVRTVR